MRPLVSTRFSFLPNSFSVFALNLGLELIHEFRGSPSPMKSKYLLIKERIKRAKIIEMQYYSKDYYGKHAHIARQMKISPKYVFDTVKRFEGLATIENRPSFHQKLVIFSVARGGGGEQTKIFFVWGNGESSIQIIDVEQTFSLTILIFFIDYLYII